MNYILDNISTSALRELARLCQNDDDCLSCQAAAKLNKPGPFRIIGTKLGN